MSDKQIQLAGRIFITFDIKAETGLHIGGSDAGIEIGGVDKTVIRDPLTNRPYIPGSSLKGKMRSLLEKYHQKEINFPDNTKTFHVCQKKESYAVCEICPVFGVSGDKDFATPTRLVVRDTFLSEKSAIDLNNAHTDLPFSEVKTEVSIDRVTSAAHPRQMERVPAGAVFSRGEMVFSLYKTEGWLAQTDVERLKIIFEGLQLIEDDYLGGLGSRGSGKVKFQDVKIQFRKDPAQKMDEIGNEFPTLAEFLDGLPGVQSAIQEKLK
jgi:CRISPR-associated protein Csm3